MKKGLVFLVISVIVIGAAVFFSGILSSDKAVQKQNPAPPAKVDSPGQENYKVLSGPKLGPVDEAPKNVDFANFRERLLKAAKEKDVDFLKAHIDEKIKYSFGVNDGIEGFMKEWDLHGAPDKSQFWQELTEVLNLGGSFDQAGSFVAPYVFAKFPEAIDAFMNHAVINEGVKLYAAPNADAEVLGLLDYNIVQIPEWKPADAWQKVKVSEGVEGYVQSQYLRSPVDYRAFFMKKDDGWKMVFFVAGD